MGGTLRGTVDAHITAANEHYAASEVFKLLFDAMESHPNTTRVSLYYGDGGASGTDYQGGASPFGREAFAVWRWEPTGARLWPFYTMFYTNSATTGTADADWLREGFAISAGDGVVLMANAVGLGGDENPWNGSTSNDGTDTVGTPRWDTPSGGTGVIISPATNREGSEDSALKNNCAALVQDASDASVRCSFIADDDGFVVLVDSLDDHSSMLAVYTGWFEAAPHLTYPTPFVSVLYHDLPPTAALSDEQAAIGDPADVTRLVQTGWISGLFTGNLQPDTQAGAYVPQRIRVYSPETGSTGFLGWLPDMLSLIYGATAEDTDLTLDRMVWGDGAVTLKVLVSWDGATVPGSTLVREGVTF